MSRFWTFIRYSAAFLVVATATMPALAQQAKPEAAAKDEAVDIYTIPEDATVEQLVAILKELKAFRPTSRDEFIAHRMKAPEALKAAAEKIVKLEKDPKSAASKLANGILLMLNASAIRNASPEEKAAFYLKAKDYVDSSDKTEEELRFAMNVAMGFEYGNARDLAAKAYAEFGEALSGSKQPEVAEQAKILIGAGRRMNLVGQPLELSGKTIAGEDFKITDLKGKVVLVDFWATWCGPCLAEYPNILANYEAYKEKGFEVVGVSLDQDREALEKYVTDKNVPWTTLHDKEAGGRHPAANYYGILGIPAVILINKEGNVISLNARGPELGKLLEKELGPAETKSEDKEASK